MKELNVELFAQRLKELRESKNLSKLQLAKKIGTSNMAITRWESCERIPNIASLYKLAVFFDVTTDYLVGLED